MYGTFNKTYVAFYLETMEFEIPKVFNLDYIHFSRPWAKWDGAACLQKPISELAFLGRRVANVIWGFRSRVNYADILVHELTGFG